MIPKHLPFANSNHAILHFRHALALDERRVKFIPSFYFDGEPGSRRHEVRINDLTGPETDVEEVFFAGAHCGTFWFSLHTKDLLFTDILSDIGGGSVANGTPNSLARIPLRWMIRECFKLNIGILFDMYMLEHEVGLDTGPILKALSSPEAPKVLSSLKPPEALSSENLLLIKPGDTELQGFSFVHIPVAVISTLGSPFRWVWKSLRKLRVHHRAAIPPDQPKPIYTSNGEAHEELVDARSPIYDQYKKRNYWKVMDRFPCKLSLSPQLVLVSGNGLIRRLQGYIKSQMPSCHVHAAPGPTGGCKSPLFLIYHRLRVASLTMLVASRNCGIGRKVYQQVMPRGMKVHRSVRTRMVALDMEGKKNKRYLPKVQCEMHDGKIRCPTREEWLEDPGFDFKWVD